MEVEIEAYLGCLQLNPSDRESLLALARLYLSSETSVESRDLIRSTITANENIVIVVETLYWDFIDNGVDFTPLERLRLGLALIAMSDGQPELKDARRALMFLVSRARDEGIVAKDHVREVQTIASDRVAPIFEKRWRRDNGRFNRFVLQNLLLDVLLTAGIVLAQSISEQTRTFVMVVLFVVIGLAHGSLLLRYMREG